MSRNGNPDVYTECADTEDTETTPLLSNVSTETAGAGKKVKILILFLMKVNILQLFPRLW